MKFLVVQTINTRILSACRLWSFDKAPRKKLNCKQYISNFGLKVGDGDEIYCCPNHQHTDYLLAGLDRWTRNKVTTLWMRSWFWWLHNPWAVEIIDFCIELGGSIELVVIILLVAVVVVDVVLITIILSCSFFSCSFLSVTSENSISDVSHSICHNYGYNSGMPDQQGPDTRCVTRSIYVLKCLGSIKA